MKVLALDPGTTESGWVLHDDTYGTDRPLLDMGIEDHDEFLMHLPDLFAQCDVLAVEMFASYGKPVGATIFDACVYIGQVKQEARHCGMDEAAQWRTVTRVDVKQALCHRTNKVTDGMVSQVLRDRLGEKGSKNYPGPLYGIKSHEWQALAVAVVVAEKLNLERQEIPA
jgi:hypothetical protein